MAKYVMLSSGDPGVKYDVDTDNWSCGCADYQYRLRESNLLDGGRRSCKHLREGMRRDREATMSTQQAAKVVTNPPTVGT